MQMNTIFFMERQKKLPQKLPRVDLMKDLVMIKECLEVEFTLQTILQNQINMFHVLLAVKDGFLQKVNANVLQKMSKSPSK